MNRRTVVLPALAAGLLTPLLAGCGSEKGGSAGGDAIVVGTTDHFAVGKNAPAPFDPAAAYDVAAWGVMRNTFQTLLRFPRTGTTPVTDAAGECGFLDANNEQYRCTVRKGQTFSNGHTLDAEDVEFSLRRLKRINHKGGPAVLFSNLAGVRANGKNEVVFRLKKPDATFPYKLTTPAAAIVDSETYPADSLTKGDQLTGSGPYALEHIDAKSAVLAKNPHYSGRLKLHNSRIELRFFDRAEGMEKALKSGDIDVMGRTISPDQVSRLDEAQDKGIELVQQPGQEIRYLAFDTDDGTVGKKAVRQAIARLVDRKKIVRDAYDRSTEPLYSIVPAGLPAHRNSFFNKYGDPSKAAAERTLHAAGIDKPVKLTLTYTTDHYGDATAEEFAALKKQLNDSGLFDVRIKGVKWDRFRPAATDGKYQVFGYGWYPDFPDADNFVAPFFEKDNFLGSPYTNREIRDELVPRTRRQTERSATTGAFGRAQDIVAEDVPILPLWQGKQYLAARDDITGVEWTLNSSSVLQLWELGRGQTD
ncbi:ABC transporter substrate-binding protein [Streptomyces spirodelae]|uniref:Peptide-binding protein n=1 Tax=Streptomyces spirodelae TaxID=2812904 RepID=A0ABS3WRC9_9ACTN|nr:ABC transporter substrate-binding protein [Streptomyces spirodelae]MBO8185685.1 peptide-binding protein [Streptomyces spirodelae]